MNKLVAALIIFLSMLLIECSKEELKEPGPNNGYSFEIVETIGPDGGSIIIDDFLLSIPVGAFDAAYEISVYTTSKGNDFGEYSATRLFAVEGLPEAYTKSLRLALKWSGSISEENYIGFGQLAEDIMSGESSVVYEAISATDSSGFLVSFMNPQNSQANALNKTIALKNEDPVTAELVFIQGFSGYTTILTDHFKIRFPNYLKNRMEEVKTILEDCYDIVNRDIGLGYYLYYESPTNVFFKPIDSEQESIIMYLGRERHTYFNINHSLIASSSQLPEFKIKFGKWLSQLSLTGHSNKTITEVLKTELLWIYFAVYTWSEELFSDPEKYISPSDFPGNEMAPFKGMKANAGNSIISAKDHGKGISAIFKYLVENEKIYGNAGLVNTFRSLSGKTPIEALITNVNALVTDWWPDFFIQYIGGNVYKVNSSVFLNSNNLSGTWDIKSNTDIQKTFTSGDVGLYPDLSAKLFAVNLNYSGLDPSANLLIDVSGDAREADALTTIAYVLKNGALEYIGHANAGIADHKIQGLSNYYGQGLRQFVIVVVNSNLYPPFTGLTDVDLTLTVGEELPELDFNRCNIGVYVKGRYNHIEPDTNYTTDVSLINPGGAGYKGSFSNNTFNGSYFEQSGPNITLTGSVEVVIDDNHTTILSLNWSENSVHSMQNWTRAKALSAENIPLSYSDSYMVFAVLGETITDHIITIRDDQSAPDGISFVIKEYWGDPDSYIKVEFYTE